MVSSVFCVCFTEKTMFGVQLIAIKNTKGSKLKTKMIPKSRQSLTHRKSVRDSYKAHTRNIHKQRENFMEIFSEARKKKKLFLIIQNDISP